jgi:sulfite reductase alpha subunit-like flavoprotein
MAMGVRTTLLNILVKRYNKNIKDAEETLVEWATQHRFVLDIWS